MWKQNYFRLKIIKTFKYNFIILKIRSIPINGIKYVSNKYLIEDQ